MIPSVNMIKREIRTLQSLSETSEDIIEKRLAYMTSEILRWTIENTQGWLGPSREVRVSSKILKDDLKDAVHAFSEQGAKK